MDDQGRSDKLCRSFVLWIFGSLLPSLSDGGFPYQAGRLVKSTSIPALSSACSQPTCDCMEFPCREGMLGASTPVPTGIQPVTGYSLPNEAPTRETFSPEPLEGLFRKDLKKNVRL